MLRITLCSLMSAPATLGQQESDRFVLLRLEIYDSLSNVVGIHSNVAHGTG